jgi:hypothetical protein
MPKKPLRHNSSNLGMLAKIADTGRVHSSKLHYSTDLVSTRANLSRVPSSRPSLNDSYCIEGSRAAIKPDHDTKK